MRVWLVQRSEPTPHDESRSRRLLRTGIMAEAFLAAGHEVVWWTSTFDHYARRQRYHVSTRENVTKGYDIQYLKGSGYKGNISLGRVLEHMSVAKEFAELASVDPKKPDIVVASMPTIELALEATKFCADNSVPVVLDIRDLWPDVYADLFPSALSGLVRWVAAPMRSKLRCTIEQSTAIVGLTENFVNWGVNLINRDRTSVDRVFPMAYIRQSVPPTELQSAKETWAKAGIRKEKNELIVAFFGTLGRGFDFGVVLAAAKFLQARGAPIKFVICGSGENLGKITRGAHRLNNVSFPGWVNAAEIQTLLEVADVGLAPYVATQNFVNNITNKPAEYLSGSVPIASSLAEGPLSVIIEDEGCGFVYGNSSEKLARSLMKLVENVDKLIDMKAAAGRTYDNYFDGHVVYSRFVSYAEEITKRGLSR